MGWVAVQTTRSMDTDMGVGTVAYSEHGRSLHGEARAALGVLGCRGGENGAAPAMVLGRMGSPYSAWPTSGVRTNENAADRLVAEAARQRKREGRDALLKDGTGHAYVSIRGLFVGEGE